MSSSTDNVVVIPYLSSDFAYLNVVSEDDYFGSSLTTLNDLLSSYDYKLICCNSHTGANCFFIKKKFAKLFKDVPSEIDKIYSEPRYVLYKRFVHKKSIKLIQQILS